jgi:4-hydroxybenzoate polyprenyltransferase
LTHATNVETASGSARLVLLARDIKLSHSVFALPFALLATYLAGAHRGRLPTIWELGLIVLCMVLARTVAMAINRWADASLDAANPRTAGRAIPSGRVTASFVLGTAAVCSGLFIAAAAGFWVVAANPWPVIASPLVLGWLVGYSFTKRCTWLCHLILGSALALSPLAAALAIDPTYLASVQPYLLAAAVLCWVAGFDVIYALQDIDSDRQTGIFSMPANLGPAPALWISRALHLLALAMLIALAAYGRPVLADAFAVGVAIVALLLAIEHALVWGSKTHRIHIAFLTVNGLISLLLGGLGIADAVRSL